MTNGNRRRFLLGCAGGMAAAALPLKNLLAAENAPFATRGVVLLTGDLSLEDWPERAARAGLTTIGLHHGNSPQIVIDCVKSPAGQKFLEKCKQLRLQVEYELHAMRELLPRKLFAKNPELFRMNDKGERTPDNNCCVHSPRALEILAENALRIAETLRPTTGRYFYWGDDAQPWCACPKCRDLSPSEQAVMVENHLCRALRKSEPQAQVAHLAYTNTLQPPKKVKPEAGVFLEYAPIFRRYDIPYERQQDPKHKDRLSALDANLEVFPKDTAQVLEYWLDISRFSGWKKNSTKLPWKKEVFLADLETYRKRGIRHVTSFAAWIDAAYRDHFGDLSFIDEYGAGLSAE
ncbi:MAG: DUF4838 domain-containing protein [Pirellulales bacterium]|nr:DUF4838 domain-containing protein [Pirellulales bacterium]